jgi:PAS domain S-box-containing protein
MVAILDEVVLREALAHAEAGTTIFTADRRILAVNDRYLDITGYSRGEVADHRAGENLRLDPLDRERFFALISSGISTGEADIVLKDGTPLAVEYVVIPTEVAGERLFIGMMWPFVTGPD